MAEEKPSSSRGEETVEVVRETSCSGADGSTSPETLPPSIPAESPSFLIWMWIQILTACSGVWGARGGGLSGPRMLGLASGAQHSLEDSESEILSRIVASKSTWSEVPGRDIGHSISVPRSSELSVWEELKEIAPNFFLEGIDEFVGLGRMIAEGGQAQIFEALCREDYVWKVFKLDAGFTLGDLKRHWPRCMRKGVEDCSESTSEQERSSGFIFEDGEANIGGSRCLILGATLLQDGRFAFLMWRYWGDLRTLIDLKVQDNSHPWEFDLLFRNGRQGPPFSVWESLWLMSKIAQGMKALHAEGVLHRDLKAANVLVMFLENLDPCLGLCICYIADYECAMFVQGTGFWRAPEVLQELLKNKEDRNGEIWTEKVDVYSFGMTCYEILTGQIPFDGCTQSKWGDVTRGERLFLPDYIFPKLRELVEACWHVQPSQRPSFEVIVEEIPSLLVGQRSWN